VTTISASAFEDSGLIALLSMPVVINIGGETFRDCDSLTGTIGIPDSVTSLGETPSNDTDGYVFAYCDNITGITLGAGITKIPLVYVAHCGKLRTENITIPANVVEIGVSAFSGCDALTDIPAMPGVTVIGTYAFSPCKGLVDVHIPVSVRFIGTGVFVDYTNMQSIEIPATGITFRQDLAYGSKQCGHPRRHDNNPASNRRRTFL
jgi:hypothetical protein